MTLSSVVTFGSGDEAGFEIAESTLSVLPNQFADVFAGRAPVSGGNRAFGVFFERFGERPR
jgi:hypothetical protein